MKDDSNSATKSGTTDLAGDGGTALCWVGVGIACDFGLGLWAVA